MSAEKKRPNDNNKPTYWDMLWSSKRGFLGCENKPYYAYLFNKYFKQRQNLTILDVGCGANTNYKFFFNDSKSCLIHFDISGVALSLSRKKMEYGQRTRGLTNCFIQGTALSLPFKSGIFDIVMSSQLLHHFKGKERGQVFGEIKRVCRRGGFVIVAVKNRYGLQSAQKMFLKNPPPFYPLTVEELCSHDEGMSVRECFSNIKIPFLGAGARCNRWLNRTFRSSAWSRWIAMDYIIFEQKTSN